tara:strand:- start:4149 stop:5000 length:852 start_codon:yes stop_codon:yes gene_type:complete
MEEWFSEPKIPLGDWIKSLVGFSEDNLYWFFDFISLVVGTSIEAMIDLLLFFPPLLIIVLVAALAFWLHRSWKLAVGALLFLLLIVNMGYWEETIKSLALILSATVACMLIGVPLGIAAAHRPKLYAALRPVLDLMQTIPTFVYLIPTMVLFGLGVVPGLISTVIFALPSPIRLTHLGISSVPKPLLEAGEAFGATKHQLLWKVELPYAQPTIMAGLTQCIMLSLSMVVIAALVGADGLGVPVIRALNTVNIPKGFEAGLAIVIVAILLDRLCKQPDKKADKS